MQFENVAITLNNKPCGRDKILLLRIRKHFRKNGLIKVIHFALYFTLQIATRGHSTTCAQVLIKKCIS